MEPSRRHAVRHGGSARRTKVLALAALCAGWLTGCGTIGPLVAPEEIGVNAKRQQDLERRQLEASQRQQQQSNRNVPPVPETGPSQEAAPPRAGEFPPDTITDPSARPSGDVDNRPR